ncbi:ATP-binding cassette domain-containing protein [Methylobacterium sp. E-045]|uniref:ATP-binding cassette domain-containing protein n=1 Tax=Methylobacterium sp. E-045 TaxID=2836575 RepID=UPI001FBB75BF|nr:ATP-binding cassette domain-containing protein [Methylobacterium sp. E-045]MCJ2129118.1 ATP-binding cassette domain-containing protein [Methylobacterium sp. E-045]
MSAALPIVIDGLRYRVGDLPILKGVDMSVTSAGITAIIGANGAGKSVLLRLIDGLLAPTGGTISIGPSAANRPSTAFVFQRPGLVRASAAANVALALAPLGLGAGERAERVRAALQHVGLAERAGAPATRLSGGEQQRLAMARAWARAPDLLLLDEPTANLDPASSHVIEDLVASMAKAGTKVVLVSHNLGQVMRLAEDVVVLAGGLAVEHGPVRTTLSSPRSPQARAYLTGEMPWTSFAALS